MPICMRPARGCCEVGCVGLVSALVVTEVTWFDFQVPGTPRPCTAYLENKCKVCEWMLTCARFTIVYHRSCGQLSYYSSSLGHYLSIL